MSKYVKIRMDHPDTRKTLESFESVFKRYFPKNELSVVEDPTGSVGWVKVPDEVLVSLGKAVIDIEEGSNTRVALDTATWYPPEMPS